MESCNIYVKNEGTMQAPSSPQPIKLSKPAECIDDTNGIRSLVSSPVTKATFRLAGDNHDDHEISSPLSRYRARACCPNSQNNIYIHHENRHQHQHQHHQTLRPMNFSGGSHMFPSMPGCSSNIQQEGEELSFDNTDDSVLSVSSPSSNFMVVPFHRQQELSPIVQQQQQQQVCQHQNTNNNNNNNPCSSPESTEDELEQRQREEEESIALARMLMAEEAEASHRASADFLRLNSGQFSQEDFEALQAALAEEEEAADEADAIAEEEDLSYETLLRLGERIGDVKADRWAAIAKKQIEKLELFDYNLDSTANKNDDNDSEIKCLVCQFQYEVDDKLRRLPCGHCFHAECVDQWLMGKDVCPYCRQTICKE